MIHTIAFVLFVPSLLWMLYLNHRTTTCLRERLRTRERKIDDLLRQNWELRASYEERRRASRPTLLTTWREPAR